MRVLVGLAVLGAIGCTTNDPVGVYRLPIQTGDKSVELRTMLVRTENSELVLWDAGAGGEFARGEMHFAWDGTPEPFELRKHPYPLTIYMRDGVIEDAIERPWATAPAQPMAANTDMATRLTLSSGAESLALTTAGGAVWSDTAPAQPKPEETASVLAVLNSFAGNGLLLPANAENAGTWRDALSVAVPPDEKHEVACAAPFVSVYRSYPAEEVKVPAGTFTAVRISEVLDSCLQRAPSDVAVFTVERWYVPGLGPVKLRYQASDARWREFLMVSTNVTADGSALWPLDEGKSWTYEVHGPDGAVVVPAAEVRVTKRESLSFP